jgi:hypothetical protein
LKVLKDNDIQLFGRRIGKKNSSITVSGIWEISDWKTGKKWNLFNYLRDYNKQSTLEFYNNFVWI